MKREDLKIGDKVTALDEPGTPFTVTGFVEHSNSYVKIMDRFNIRERFAGPANLHPVSPAKHPGGWWCGACGKHAAGKIKVLIDVTQTFEKEVEFDPDDPVTLYGLQNDSETAYDLGPDAIDCDWEIKKVVCPECGEELTWEKKEDDDERV